MQVEFDKRYSDIEWGYERHRTMLQMIKKAAEKVDSTEAMAVVKALEGLTFETESGPARMRADNHQLLQPLFVSVFSKDVKYDAEDTATETTCNMKRPG